jgi:hypothetical protein
VDSLLEFLRPYAIVIGTAVVLYFVVRPLIKLVAGRTTRWGAGQVTRAVRSRDPAATVAPGANAWSCGRCKSVNRPDAVVCYSCRGARAEVEHLQGRI